MIQTLSIIYAVSLSGAITHSAKTHGVKPAYLHAIALVESGANVSAPTRTNTNGTRDVGPFQINSVHRRSTCKRYNVDSLTGNALCAGKLIKLHAKHKKTDPCWLARYHSKTPRLKRAYCKKLRKVLKF